MPRTGSLETQLSLDQAMERIAGSHWAAEVTFFLASRAIDHVRFTSDDIREQVGDPPGSGCSLGAILAAEVRAHRIVVVDRAKSTRPERHRARLNVYEVAA